MITVLSYAWTLFWIVSPYPAFVYGMVVFGRWVQRRSEAEAYAQSFVDRFIPENADVAARLSKLPRMKGQVC